jgi:hypothetical protein
MGLVWAVCRFFVQRATVTLQNNEHDDTEHQQQRIRSHHDHLLRRIIASEIRTSSAANQAKCNCHYRLSFGGLLLFSFRSVLL